MYFKQVSRQIAFGMDKLVKENAANIHDRSDWMTIFTILKSVGAGSRPQHQVVNMTSSSDEVAAVTTEDDVVDQLSNDRS